MYDVLQSIHVIAAIAWVGGGIFHVFASTQLAGAPPETMGHWAQVGERAGQVYYGPAAVLTLLAGIGMVLVGDLSWGQPLVSVGFTGVALSFVLGAVLTERASKELTAELDGGDTGRIASLQQRIRMYSVLDVVVLLVVVVVMVVQPG